MLKYEAMTREMPVPQKAWIFYENQGRYGGRSAGVCEHEVHNTEKGPVLGVGRPLDQAGLLRTLREAAEGRPVLHRHQGILPANVLQYDEEKLTWYVPGKVRKMYWTGSRKGTQTLVVPWPTLVFRHRKGRGLELFAVRGSRRPGLSTPIFHAPLANVYGGGDVCLGNADRGILSLESIPVWEEAIFDTRFSHINHSHTLKPQACGLKSTKISTAAHLRFWKGLAKEQAKRFPSTALNPMESRRGKQLCLGDVL